VIRASLPGALSHVRGLFDVIFVDPPYADSDGSVAATLGAMDQVLADTGIVVVHRHARSDIEFPDFLTSIDERRYGDAVVTMLERLQS